MTAAAYRTRDGQTVTAMPVPDDLGAVMQVAIWIRNNGGIVTSPLHTFDCAFRIGEGEGAPVNVGDWVVRYDDGGFEAATDAEFAEEFEAVAA